MTEHGAHPGVGTLLWPAVNFVLFVALLWKVLPGPVREVFRQRTVRIREALAAGQRALAEAEATRAALERDVAALPDTIARLRADLRAAAERERDNVVGGARRAAERIRADARLLADHEVAAARQALRAEVVDEAIREATAAIRGAIRPEDQERLVRDFVHSAGATA
jgi:F-type H+-transporting ATPase subunit b